MRTGETCDVKLITSTVSIDQKCKLCVEIDIKMGRWQAEARWVNKLGKKEDSTCRSTTIIELAKAILETVQTCSSNY
jgi:hypothetical protein